MPASAKSYILDTSALLCLKENEPGADVVEQLLRDYGTKAQMAVCFISLMEFYYIIHQELGEEEARRGYLLLKQFPLRVVESDEELGLSAARLKAQNKVSLAD